MRLRQQPDEESLNLPSKKNNPKRAQNQTPEKRTPANNKLTRFGLNAYVLGAIKREVFTLEDDYNC